MKKLRNLLLGVILAFTFVSNTMCVNYIKADELAKDNLGKYLQSDSYIKIGDTQLSENETTVTYTNKFSLHFEWAFENGQYPTSQEDKLTYTLPEGFSITTASGSITNDNDTSKEIGTYTIESNKITIQYNKGDETTTYLNQQNRVGHLNLEGTLDNSITNNGNGGSKEFSFDGIGTFKINMDKDTSNDGVWIEKTGGTYNSSNNTATFYLKITARGAQNNIVVTDTTGENLTYREDVKYYRDENRSTEISGVTTTTTNDSNEKVTGFTSTISSMSDGQVIYAQYTVAVSKKALVESNNNWNKATVKSDSSNGNEAWKEIDSIKISEWGSKTVDVDKNTKTATWTLTVGPKDNSTLDISGTVIKDVIDSGLTLVEGSFSVNPSLEGLTFETLISNNGYTLPEGSKGTYTITYKTTYTEPSVGTKTYSNKLKVNPFGNTTNSKGYESSFEVGEDFTWITKECITTGNQQDVKWKVTIKVGADTENLKVVDKLDDKLEYTGYEIVSGFTSTDSKPTVTKSDNDKKITFEFGKVNKDTTIVMTVKSKIITLRTENGTSEYENKVMYYDNNTKKQEAKAKYTYTVVNPLSKSYVWSGDKKMNTWCLKLDALSDASSSVVITDNLPENMKYKDGSLLVLTSDYKQLDSEVLSAITTSQEEKDGKYVLTINFGEKAIEYSKTYKLVMFYETEFVDVSKAVENKEYKNSAYVTVDETQYGEVSATTWKQLENKDIVDKSAEYNGNTAPDVKYTIVVNKDGLDLADGDTLTLEDIMASSLDYNMGSIKVTRADGSNYALTDDAFSYDTENHKLTIKVPDGEKITIEYTARLNLSIGTDLTEANSTNTCKLSGSKVDEKSGSNKLSGSVVQSTAGGSSNGVSIRVYKYGDNDTNKPLEGAKFAVYTVEYEDSNKVASTTEVQTATSNAQGYANINGLGGTKVYMLKETSAPVGYTLDETPLFFYFTTSNAASETTYPESVTYDGKTYQTTIITDVVSYTYYMSNETTKETKHNVEISKVSATGSKEIEGASLTIYKDSEKGQVVTSWVSGVDGMNEDGTVKTHTVTLEEGTYVLKETQAPNGYEIAESITFVVGSNGTVTVNGETVTKVTMTDKEIATYDVEISKVDATSKNELPGALLTITKGEIEVARWTSTNETHKVKLEAGTYTLTEVTAPEGYEKAESIKFTVTSEGKVTVGDNEVTKVTMEDAVSTHTVKISKVDATNREELVGAELKITKGENTVDSWTSTKDKHEVILEAGTYTLTETTAPNGYRVAESIEFTVDNNGKVTVNGKDAEDNTVTMEDAHTEGKLVITKTIEGAVTESEAKGAISFKVTDPDNNVKTYTLTNVTPVDGVYTIEIDHAKVGNYKVVEEVTDITGKTLASTSYTVGNVTEGGKEANVSVEDNETTTVAYKNAYTTDTGVLVITKTIEGDVTKEEAEGTIKFIVTDSNKKETTYTLKENGVYENGVWTITINDVVVGEYTVEEVITDEISGRIFKCYTVKVNGGNEQYDDPTVNVTANETTTVAYKNTYERYHYILEKHDLNDTDKVLTGATYKLQKYDDEKGSYLDLYDANGKIVDFTTGVNGQVTISDEGFEGFRLTEGTYRLVETGAPTGYDLGESKVFTISGTAVLMMLDDEEAEQRPMIGATLRVYDAKLTEKPKEEPKKEEPKEDKVYSEEKHEYVYRVVNTSSK